MKELEDMAKMVKAANENLEKLKQEYSILDTRLKEKSQAASVAGILCRIADHELLAAANQVERPSQEIFEWTHERVLFSDSKTIEQVIAAPGKKGNKVRIASLGVCGSQYIFVCNEGQAKDAISSCFGDNTDLTKIEELEIKLGWALPESVYALPEFNGF